MTEALSLILVSKAGEAPVSFTPSRLIVAGWTGRDPAAMEAHMAELEALGVKRPQSTPVFYRVAAARLTQAGTIQVSGADSSGEAEYLLVNLEGRVWVGAGSDHTDRAVETYGITVSKQMCDKPLAARLWPLDEVEAHWDRLILRSDVEVAGKRARYQEGTLAAMRPPRDLLDRFAALEDGGLRPGEVMMGGTLPAIGGVRPAARFDFELEDPVLGRRIAGGYAIETLAVVG
ncbi:MAG: DUF2848 domain-containing protein [Rhodospirillales bacterium]